MATTVPGLDSTSDILDNDMLMITHSTGLTEKLSGLEFNKRNRIIIANNLTITGSPLHTGNVVRVHFTADIAGANGTNAMVINYNGTNYNVKAPSNGSLKNFTASSVDGAYKYLQAYTTLELLFDGTQFVIIGNPVVISSTDYTIYTDGSKIGGIKTYTFTGTGTGEWTQMAGSVTLEAGVWQVSLYGKTKSTTFRLIQVPNLISTWFDIATTTNDTSYHEIVSLTVKLTTAKSIYVNNFNSKGSAVTVFLNAVRLR